MQTLGSRLRVAVLACLTLWSVSLANAQKKPNILVIFGDDIGWFNLSAYNIGMMGYRTPNIDRIAPKGCCSPATTRSKAALPDARLAAFITGQSPCIRDF
jgi:arylsulfatase